MKKLTLNRLANSPVAVTIVVALCVAAVVGATNIHGALPDTNIILDLSPGRFLSQTLAVFNGNQLGQSTPGSAIAYVPMGLVYYVLVAIGLPLGAVQGIWIAVLIATSAGSMAWLFVTWVAQPTMAASVLSGMLYGMSPYVWLNLKGATVLLVPYALAPLLCTLILRVMRGGSWKAAAGFVLLVGLTGIGVNPPETIIAGVEVAAIVVGELLQWPAEWVSGIRRAGVTVIVACFMSIWWIGPFVESLSIGGIAGYFTTDPLSVQAASSSFREVMRLTGLWALYSGNNGVPYYPESGFLTSKVVVAVTLLPAAILAGGFLRLRKQEAWRGFLLAGLVAVAVPLAVSVYPPGSPGLTGHLYQWLYSHVTVFRAFRSGYKWVAVLAFVYALGVPMGLERTGDSSRRRWNRIAEVVRDAAVGIMVAAVVLYAVPGISGNLFPASYRLGSVPSYWLAAGRWLDTQPAQGRVLFVPFVGFPDFTWGDPSGPIASAITSRPSLMAQPGLALPSGAEQLLALVAEAGTGATVPFARIARLLGVRYIVDEEDAAWRAIGSPRPTVLTKFLIDQSGIREVKQFGRLRVFEVGGTIAPEFGVAQSAAQVASDTGLGGAVTQAPVGDLVRPETVKVVNPVVARVTASSVWNGLDSVYGPQEVLAGGPSSAWVPNVPYGRHQWIKIAFKHPVPVGSVTVVVRHDGKDAEPKVLNIAAGERSIDATVSDATAVAAFGGKRVRSVEIRIGKVGKGGPNVGIAEVQIPGVPVDAIQYPTLGAVYPFSYGVHEGTASIGNMRHELVSTATRAATLTGTLRASPMESDRTLAQYLQVHGVTQVTASSRWHGLAAYSPLWTLAGDPKFGWVPNEPGGTGSWVQYQFPNPRVIGTVGITPRSDGVDAVVSTVSIAVDGRTVESAHLVPGTRTTVDVPVVGSNLRLTIAGAGGAEGKNIGISSVVIPGVSVSRNVDAFGPGRWSIGETSYTIVRAVSVRGSGGDGVDEMAVGDRGIPIKPISIVVPPGENVIRWSGGGILGAAHFNITGGNPGLADITAVPTRKLAEGQYRIGAMKKGLLVADWSSGIPWVSTGARTLQKVGNWGYGYGPVWAVGGSTDGTVIAYESGISNLDWLVAQAVVGGIGFLGMFAWQQRRKASAGRREG